MTMYGGCTYDIPYTLSFYDPGVSLTIEPGATLRFAEGAGLHVNSGAKLRASGTEEAPIVMSAASPAAGWEGVSFVSTGIDADPHTMEYVTLRQAGAFADPGSEDGGYAIYIESDSVRLIAVTVEDGPRNGIRIFREYSDIASGSSGLSVSVKDYPIIADAQNLGSIPEDSMLSSTSSEKARVLAYSGDAGMIDDEDVAWPLLAVPIELGASIDLIGGSLTIPAGADVRVREPYSIRVQDQMGGSGLHVDGTADAPVNIDWARDGAYWDGIIFSAPHSPSVVRHANVRHGGIYGYMIQVNGPGGHGSFGDCEAGPTIEQNTFADAAPDAYCLWAEDSSNAYEADNTFDGCAVEVQCD
jgi:hypothetical protein